MGLENEQYYRGRSYASEDHTNTDIRPKLVITYTVPSGDPVADKMNHIFAPLDKSQVPTGFLADYGAEFLPLDIFNGVLTDSNKVNMDVWRMAYASLYTSRIYGTNPLPTFASINNTLESAQSETSATPVAIVFSKYGYIKADAFSNNLLKLENEQLKDVPGRTQSPYAERFFFTASPVSNYANSGTVALVFKPELFYNTTGKTAQSLYIDFADGAGYVTASWNTPITATYTSDGIKLIKLKVSFTDNTSYECYSQLEVWNASSVAFRYPTTPQLQPQPFNANPGIHSGGTLFISLGENHTTITKPLIVVEGYDPSGVAPGLAPSYNYRNFINAINEPKLFSFNHQLDLAGYDLIFLNFNDGVDDITRNAALFEEVVNWVNAQKGSGGEPNVVMGLSMGGLVARYGLAKMTKEGKNTSTRLLITHDSPHQGANVPLGFQHLLTSLPGVVVKGIKLSDASEMFREAEKLMGATATKQMLIIRSEGGNAVENTFLSNVYKPMVTFSTSGPQPSYRFIATSQGSECGQQLFTPYAGLGAFNGHIFFGRVPEILRVGLKAEMMINALPEQGTSKRITYMNLRYEVRLFWYLKLNINLLNISKNAPSYALPWDGAPGGTYSLSDGTTSGSFQWRKLMWLGYSGSITGEFTFVPTVSALDISPTTSASLAARFVGGISTTSPSTASNFIAQERMPNTSRYNIEHISFTDRNSEWLFNEMQNSTNNTLNCSSECALTVAISSSSNSVCGGTAYFSVPNYGSGVTYSWSVGPGLTIVSGNGTSQIEVTSTSGNYSSSTVSVNVNTKCGTESASTTVNIGSGPAYISNPYDMSCYCQVYGLETGKTYQFFVENSASGVDPGNYLWTITPPLNSPEPYPMEYSGSSIYFDPYYPGEYTFQLQQYTPGCGWSVKDTRSFYVNQGYDMYAYAYPNPTSDELNVSLSNAFPDESGKTDSNYEVRLLNEQQKEVYFKRTKDKQIIIPVQKFKGGTYYLQLKSGDRTVVSRIVIGKQARQ